MTVLTTLPEPIQQPNVVFYGSMPSVPILFEICTNISPSYDTRYSKLCSTRGSILDASANSHGEKFSADLTFCRCMNIIHAFTELMN